MRTEKGGGDFATDVDVAAEQAILDGRVADSVHFAAGIALCAAAGCVVTDLRGGPPDGAAGGLPAAADHETHEAPLAMAARQLDS